MAELPFPLSMFRDLFALTLLNRCFKEAILFHIRKNPCFRNFTLKTAKDRFNVLIFSWNDLGHLNHFSINQKMGIICADQVRIFDEQ